MAIENFQLLTVELIRFRLNIIAKGIGATKFEFSKPIIFLEIRKSKGE